MEDKEIIDLYWSRSEQAIFATDEKYHSYCRHIASAILNDTQDAEECVNDTLMKVWKTIPPNKPNNLATYIGKITRTTAIDSIRRRTRKRRGGREVDLTLEELGECISVRDNVEQQIEEKELTEKINSFLGALSDLERNVFVCRYWYLESVKEIARSAHSSESRIKSMLFRVRKKLKTYLIEEGYYVGK